MAAEEQQRALDAVVADRETQLTASVEHWMTDHSGFAHCWEHCVSGQRIEVVEERINQRTPTSRGDQMFVTVVRAPDGEPLGRLNPKSDREEALMQARAWMRCHRDGMGVVE